MPPGGLSCAPPAEESSFSLCLPSGGTPGRPGCPGEFICGAQKPYVGQVASAAGYSRRAGLTPALVYSNMMIFQTWSSVSTSSQAGMAER